MTVKPLIKIPEGFQAVTWRLPLTDTLEGASKKVKVSNVVSTWIKRNRDSSKNQTNQKKMPLGLQLSVGWKNYLAADRSHIFWKIQESNRLENIRGRAAL